MFVSHFVSTSSQGSPWVQHMRILRFIVTWTLSTNEKVWKLSVSTRALSSQRRRAVSVRFTRRRFFLLQFTVFFLPGSTKSIPNVGKWCFSQLSFDLPVLSPLFAYLNKDRSITLWYSFVSILKRQVVFMFICLKISTFLFADTYSLQSKGNCMALKSTTSAKSLHDKQIKQTLTWGFDSETSMKILHLCYY